MSYVVALLTLLERLKGLSGINAAIQRGLAAAESIFGLLDHEEEADTGTVVLERSPRRGALRAPVAALSAATSARRCPTSRSRSRPGETVALVGASGSGKTSLVNLVPRFYEPTAGRLFIDGHDVTTLTLKSLRAQIAMVSQDVLLFNDTVAANIAYGAMAGASREEVERAAAAAHALDFIRAMPEGFDTHRRRERRPAVGRPAPAHRDRARDPQERADPDPRRGDLGARFRIRAAGAGRARHADARAHDHRHRASAVDDRGRRSHRRPRRAAASSRSARTRRCSPRNGTYARLHRIQFTHAPTGAATRRAPRRRFSARERVAPRRSPPRRRSPPCTRARAAQRRLAEQPLAAPRPRHLAEELDRLVAARKGIDRHRASAASPRRTRRDRRSPPSRARTA